MKEGMLNVDSCCNGNWTLNDLFCILLERIEHTLNDDHQDSIIALCSCQKLELFASASTNGIIKVWNERSEIVGYVTCEFNY